MIPSSILGIVFALASAVSWGTGDFGGGVATRTKNQFQVLFLASLPGIVILGLMALVTGEPLPSWRDILWAFSGGLSGALGIAYFYQGLSRGNTATIAPTAAAIGACLPVVFGILSIGIPGALKLAGFVSAIAGIWFVSRPHGNRTLLDRQGLLYAVIAGTGFGVFFVLLAQVEKGLVFGPLVFSKLAALVLATGIILSRGGRVPSLVSSPVAILAGVFDAGGNAFYMLARQFTRLDVAAVLSSMYPAVTVILSCLILKEQVSASQWSGVVLCLFAIALISM